MVNQEVIGKLHQRTKIEPSHIQKKKKKGSIKVSIPSINSSRFIQYFNFFEVHKKVSM